MQAKYKASNKARPGTHEHLTCAGTANGIVFEKPLPRTVIEPPLDPKSAAMFWISLEAGDLPWNFEEEKSQQTEGARHAKPKGGQVMFRQIILSLVFATAVCTGSEFAEAIGHPKKLFETRPEKSARSWI